MGTAGHATHREPWNEGKIVGQKVPFKLKDIWALRAQPHTGPRGWAPRSGRWVVTTVMSALCRAASSVKSG